jgi:hypothetical protein
MNFEELERVTRRWIADEISASNVNEEDLLVDNQMLAVYFNEAQRKFCKRTGFIRESSSAEAATITMTAGDQEAPLHGSIIKVRKVFKNGAPLRHLRQLDLLPYNSATAQPPSYWGADLEDRIFRLNAPLDADATFTLAVWRKPINYLTGSNPRQVPEIPEDYHLALTHFAAAMVFSSADEELVDNKAMAKQMGFFDRMVLEAKRESQMIADDGAEPGFEVGQLGWSW